MKIMKSLFFCAKQLKIPDAKAAADKELKKLEQLAVGKWPKYGAKKKSFKRHRRRKEYADGHLSSQECGIRTDISEIQRPFRTLR